ncbi:hypothetical protein GUITHDRAFT_131968 [Guillardia theta CCMP2712]|uniref:N-acetyltransferase domain-containing protein n=2 Tax=Guillardia theta TaxID=55529 RepID=L1K337_GUITC|nr:hypothetical protein GUITHDRAFT_131968 [Guillardia theta CCMP2712]EKX55024.1 hypothetical protein GUITHDRAFT_131968 [Guillardia theta CCMP2712]|eukprot:XP_005842004.1 hypothetical protein GUITHDRAFT_131968 [Guillardia theta CCMP2712]
MHGRWVLVASLLGVSQAFMASPLVETVKPRRSSCFLQPHAPALRGAPRRSSRTMMAQADATESQTYKFIRNSAARTAFILNNWKAYAENSRALGWTSSSTEAMIKLQRESATADVMKAMVPMIMQKAAADKAAEENGSMPASIPQNIAKLNVIAAVSVGAGSSAAVYTKGEGFYTVEYIVANTQMTGQFESQVALLNEVAREAKEEGVKEIRLACNSLPPSSGSLTSLDCLYGSLDTFGFKESEAGVPWYVRRVSE